MKYEMGICAGSSISGVVSNVGTKNGGLAVFINREYNQMVSALWSRFTCDFRK